MRTNENNWYHDLTIDTTEFHPFWQWYIGRISQETAIQSMSRENKIIVTNEDGSVFIPPNYEPK